MSNNQKQLEAALQGHTPGPWETRGVDVIGKDAYGTALVAIAKGGVSINPEANARLIAAAPDLLAALKRIRYFHRTNDTPNSDPWLDVDAAIAKATGERK